MTSRDTTGPLAKGADMSTMTSNYWVVPAGYSDPVPFKAPNWRLMLALGLNLLAWAIVLMIAF